MLKAIIIVTILTLNVEKTAESYSEHLEYRAIDSGIITANLARSWGAYKVTDAKYVVMQPRSDKPVYLRFIEQTNAPLHKPMRQTGWNAIEILVKNPDSLATQFKSSPFQVIGKPKYLTDKQNVRAFQALGVNQELFYFTRIIDSTKSNFDLGMAMSKIDNVFIMVMGTSQLERVSTFYQDILNTPVAGPFPYKIGVLSEAYDLPKDTIHSLSLAQLSGQFLIEIDQYPESAEPLVVEEGNLPAGIAIVSFTVESLSNFEINPISAPMKHHQAPYFGRQSATIKGIEGELIELIEREQSLN